MFPCPKCRKRTVVDTGRDGGDSYKRYRRCPSCGYRFKTVEVYAHIEPRKDDGTDRLCMALYGRKAMTADIIGGSDARMLHDAADMINRLKGE